MTLVESGDAVGQAGGRGRHHVSRDSFAARQAGSAAHRWPAVAELLGLHRLPLAAVRNGIEPEVRSHRVDVHEVLARVGHDAAVAIETAQPAITDLVDLA